MSDRGSRPPPERISGPCVDRIRTRWCPHNGVEGAPLDLAQRWVKGAKTKGMVPATGELRTFEAVTQPFPEELSPVAAKLPYEERLYRSRRAARPHTRKRGRVTGTHREAGNTRAIARWPCSAPSTHAALRGPCPSPPSFKAASSKSLF